MIFVIFIYAVVSIAIFVSNVYLETKLFSADGHHRSQQVKNGALMILLAITTILAAVSLMSFIFLRYYLTTICAILIAWITLIEFLIQGSIKTKFLADPLANTVKEAGRIFVWQILALLCESVVFILARTLT